MKIKSCYLRLDSNWLVYLTTLYIDQVHTILEKLALWISCWSLFGYASYGYSIPERGKSKVLAVAFSLGNSFCFC
jgi:hypothetical protein